LLVPLPAEEPERALEEPEPREERRADEPRERLLELRREELPELREELPVLREELAELREELAEPVLAARREFERPVEPPPRTVRTAPWPTPTTASPTLSAPAIP